MCLFKLLILARDSLVYFLIIFGVLVLFYFYTTVTMLDRLCYSYAYRQCFHLPVWSEFCSRYDGRVSMPSCWSSTIILSCLSQAMLHCDISGRTSNVVTVLHWWASVLNQASRMTRKIPQFTSDDEPSINTGIELPSIRFRNQVVELQLPLTPAH